MALGMGWFAFRRWSFVHPIMFALLASCTGGIQVTPAGSGEGAMAAEPLGGADGRSQGLRNAPSLRYVLYTPSFHFESDGTPVGGFDRDGRAASLRDQARGPFLAAFEMANADAPAVSRRLAAAGYADEFRAQFGEGIFEDPAAALSEAEARGLSLFNDPNKGNCAACHPSAVGADGSPPMFTDFTYDNLGVPRNAAIAANADPGYYDLGACGPLRTDIAEHTELCGAFKVPTLRNIALTAPRRHTTGCPATCRRSMPPR